MEDDEDDIYGRPSDPQNGVKLEDHASKEQIKKEDVAVAVEEEDEEGDDDDDSDSDVDIITERTPNQTSTAPERQPSKAVPIKHERTQSASVDTPASKRPATSTPTPAARPDSARPAGQQVEPLKPGTDYPEVHTSTVDINAEVPYEATGKPITGVDIDADLAEKEKPWRRPGQDQSDYFNYGFDEFTWTQYCLKQGKLRGEVTQLNAEKDSMFGGPASGMQSGGIPGMDNMNMSPEEMQHFMQMMAGQGGDMSQMPDFNAMMGQMGGMGGMGGGGGGGFTQPGMIDGPQPPTGPSGSRNQYGGGGRGRGRRW